MSLIANRPVSQYRAPLRSRDLPLPPRWTPREKAIAQARLKQFIVLSMLVHAFAILMFGAPGSGHREGRAMWGSLNVVLKSYRAAVAPRVEPAPQAPATVTPQAASPAPVAPPPPSQSRSPEPVDFPPMMDQLAPSEVKVPPSTDFKPAEIQVLPVPTVPEPLLQPLPAMQDRPNLPALETPVIRVPAEAPRIPAPVLKPMPALPERTTLPKMEAPIIRVPAETPRLPAPLLQPLPSMQDRATLPAIETPVIRVPVETPAIPERLVQPMRSLPESSALPPVEKVPEPPPIPARPIPEAPPSIQRAPAAPEAPRPAPKASEELARPPQDIAPRTTPDAAPRPTLDAAPRPAPDAAPRAPAPAETIREPESPFRSREAPADPSKPTLDLESIRQRAGEITRQGTGNRAVLPFPMPPVEKPKSKMEQAIENARKPDCREAYKALGLFAVVPLVANEFGEGHCRW
jgi:hypothetical protein